jgi:CRP/FNR family transcriptional regulator, anaerobic regulatory protein
MLTSKESSAMHKENNLLAFKTSNSMPVQNQSKLSSNCRLCEIKDICEHSKTTTTLVEPLSVAQRIFHKNNEVCGQGNNFNAIFIVRSGTLKSYTLNAEGEMQVTGFYSAGQIVGFDGIFHGNYQSTVVALDTASVCRVGMQDIEQLSSIQPKLFPQLLKLMSAEICDDKAMFLALSKKSAEKRLAQFLHNHSTRLEALQLNHSRFNLPMTRSELGNYLGMAVETVSREFSRLHNNGIVKVTQRDVTILDLEKLRKLLGILDYTNAYPHSATQ